ncbi:MAG TPA: nucleotide sugar dehydrogenase, partial [Parvularcula sp.]|nr:nucleotide sugar dehydrogenase [Parvularcula sp.]
MPLSKAQSIAARVASGAAAVGVVGLGYVGAPLALAFWRAGFSVLGVDISAGRVEAINAGEQVINYIPAEAFRDAAASPKFEATTDFARLEDADVIVICVPTPLTRHNEPDLSFIRATGEAIRPHLRSGQTVILESTTWPGTTREVLKPVLDKSGLVCGRDYFLAFSPEREDPGNPHFSTASIPKVVGADD